MSHPSTSSNYLRTIINFNHSYSIHKAYIQLLGNPRISNILICYFNIGLCPVIKCCGWNAAAHVQSHHFLKSIAQLPWHNLSFGSGSSTCDWNAAAHVQSHHFLKSIAQLPWHNLSFGSGSSTCDWNAAAHVQSHHFLFIYAGRRISKSTSMSIQY